MSSDTTKAIEDQILDCAIASLLAAGLTIDVYDGEEFTLTGSTDPGAIKAQLRSTSDDYLYVNRITQPCACTGPCPLKQGAHLGTTTHCRNEHATTRSRRCGWVWLIWGNGWDVISDWTNGIDPILQPALAIAERLSNESVRATGAAR